MAQEPSPFRTRAPIPRSVNELQSRFAWLGLESRGLCALPEKENFAYFEPIRWTPEGIVMLDQRRLPGEVIYHTYTDYRDVAKAIKDMVIRGAPAIGVAAAMGIAIGVEKSQAKTLDELRAEFATICETLAHTRPTAVDFFWAIERFKRRFDELASAAAKRLDRRNRPHQNPRWWKKRKKCIRSAAKPTSASAALARSSCRNPGA